MSGFIEPLDSAEQLARIRTWIEQHGKSDVAVLIGPAPDPADFEDGEEYVDDREVEFTHGSPFLAGKTSEERQAVVRLRHSRRLVALDSVEPHPRYAEVAGLATLNDGDEHLEFPPPDCAFCRIGLTCDGDGWYCEQCAAGWNSAGTSCTRRCVEPDCDADAEVAGEDKQPRCTPCAFQVLVGAIVATPPYLCTNSWCRTKVIGMPYWAKARRSGYGPVCGRCQEKTEHDAWMESYMARTSRPTVSTEAL